MSVASSIFDDLIHILKSHIIRPRSLAEESAGVEVPGGRGGPTATERPVSFEQRPNPVLSVMSGDQGRHTLRQESFMWRKCSRAFCTRVKWRG